MLRDHGTSAAQKFLSFVLKPQVNSSFSIFRQWICNFGANEVAPMSFFFTNAGTWAKKGPFFSYSELIQSARAFEFAASAFMNN